MTCIAAIVDNGVIYMGGDSAGVSGIDLTLRADQKVFMNGDFLIGFTSSFRMGQLLRYAFKPPKYREDEKDLYAYMVTDFVDAVRKCLKDGGYAQIDKGEEIGGFFLVGIKGRLFEIESDYQVGETMTAYNAVGCGRAYALGAFSASIGDDPVTRLNKALSAAEKFSAGVSSPFKIIRWPDSGKEAS